MKLGTFTQDQDGVATGTIRMLSIGVLPVAIVPDKSKKGETYFHLIADPNGNPYEIGLAFEKTDKHGKPYYSVSMDSPMFAEPIRAFLFPDKEHEGVFNLLWDRLDEDDKPTAKLGQKAEANGGEAADAGQAQGRRNGGPKLGATL